MKRLLLLPLLVAAIAGCTLTGDEEDTSLSASTYLPFVAGQTWTYSVTTTGSESGTYTKTRTNTGTATYNGKTYFLLEDSRSDSGDPETIRLRVEGETVYMLPSTDGSEVAFFKFGIEAGTSWLVRTGSTMTYVGLETVTTPAGTYTNCAKFSFTESGTNYTYTETIWFASNVGPVKQTWVETKESGTSSSVSLMTDYTSGTDTGTTLSLSTYLPFASGVRWAYSNSSTGESTVRTVLGTTTHNSATYWRIREVHSNSNVDTTLVRATSNIMYMLKDNTEVPYFKFGITAGTSWIVDGVTATYVGLETVTTTAGTYTNCAKFSYVSNSETQYEWLAPGVGPVKFSHMDGGVPSTYALTSFSTTGGNAEDNTVLSTYLRFSSDNEYWTYSCTSSSVSNFTLTRSVTGTAMINGKTYWLLIDTPQGGDPDTSGVRIDGETMYMLHRNTIIESSLSGSDTSYTYTEIPFFTFGLATGTSWTTTDGTVTYVGLETVTTPAGTYTNCAKFTVTRTWTQSSMNGSFTVTNTDTEWLAPGIGPVKETSQSNVGSTQYNRTAVLTNYHVSN